MKLAITSDTHGFLPDVDRCDMLIHAGDMISPDTQTHRSLHKQQQWFMNNFMEWLSNIDTKYIIIVPGNHDKVFEELPFFMKDFESQLNQHLESEVHVMTHDCRDVGGFQVFGSSWTPYYCGWAFNSPSSEQASQDFMCHKWFSMPDNLDILVTHGPPHKIMDKIEDGTHQGCPELKNAVLSKKPRLHVFGHIHGQENTEMITPDTKFLNAAYTKCIQDDDKEWHYVEHQNVIYTELSPR